MNDEFETRVAAWMRERAQPDPTALAAVRGSIDALPGRRRGQRRGWLLATAAVLAIVAVGLSSLLLSPSQQGTGPSGPSRPVPPDPAAFAGDPRIAACLGTAAPVQYAFEMAHARDYQRHLPAMLLSPELDVDDPAFVVVFAAGARIVGGAPPPASDATSAPANSRSVCVLVAGVPNLYENVDISGMRADLGADALATSPAPGPSTDHALESFAPEPTRDLRFVPISSLVLAADHRHITIDFVGSHEFVPGNPCSIEYEALTNVVNGVLEIGVLPKAGVLPDAGPTAVTCDDLGYPRTLNVVLDAPFSGTRWHDRTGYLHFLAPPNGLVELTGLPAGWVLRKGRDVEESPAGRWERTYSPDASLADPTRTVVLYQTFDGSVPVTGGEEVTQVQVNGRAATLYRYAPSGELVLVWQLGSNGLGLVAFEQEFSQGELIALAESARGPGS
jgi:hypothetical protein